MEFILPEKISDLSVIQPTTDLTNRSMYRIIVRHYEDYGVNIAVDADNKFFIPEEYVSRIETEYARHRVELEVILKNKAKAVPYAPGSYVYFLLSQGQVVYIGESSNLANRISQHVWLSKQFDEVSYIEVPASERTFTEGINILAHQPKYNLSIPSEMIFAEVLRRLFS